MAENETVNQAPVAEAQTPAQPAQEAKPAESNKEYNFRILREQLERAEKEKEELRKQMLSQQAPQVHQQVSEADDVDLNISDDDWVDGKNLKKIVAKQYKELKEIKKTLSETSQYNQVTTADLKLKAQYSDFADVVNEDNLKTFAKIYPEEYASVMANPDFYGRAKTAYNMIKNFGVAQKYEQEDKKLAENKQKPRSAAGSSGQVADTPLTKIGDYDRRVLTEERKDQLRRQVEQAKRGY